MKTLEKVEKVQKLEMEIHNLKNEIREEQRKCKHEYPEKPLFNSQYFYARCVKCGYEYQVEHNVDIFDDETYKTELQESWNKLILNK